MYKLLLTSSDQNAAENTAECIVDANVRDIVAFFHLHLPIALVRQVHHNVEESRQEVANEKKIVPKHQHRHNHFKVTLISHSNLSLLACSTMVGGRHYTLYFIRPSCSKYCQSFYIEQIEWACARNDDEWLIFVQFRSRFLGSYCCQKVPNAVPYVHTTQMRVHLDALANDTTHKKW